MLRRIAALSLMAAWASSGVPTLRFAQRNSDAWGAPKSATRDPLLAADSADILSVVPLGDVPLADG